jgi:DNA-binding MarR family transcriptional regulator
MKPSSDRAPGRDVLTPADYEALAAFRYAVRRYLAFAEGGARSAGLTSQQHQALLAIKAQSFTGPMSIGDLAAQLLIKHHSAVELVGRLEKAGLTRRTADADDRRKVLVSLTAGGEAVLALLSESNLKELRMVAPAFSGLLERLARLDG